MSEVEEVKLEREGNSLKVFIHSGTYLVAIIPLKSMEDVIEKLVNAHLAGETKPKGG